MIYEEQKQPWGRMNGEPNRWFQRFERYRLSGPGRAIEAVYRAECEAKKRDIKRPSYLWYKRSKEWLWESRAGAYDQYLVGQASAKQEAEWQAKIMGPTEVLGRMSEHGRNDMGQYFKVTERWTEKPLPSEEILQEEEFFKMVLDMPVPCTRYLVRKVVVDMDAFLDPDRSRRIKKFSDSPKNGLSIELYDAHNAQANVGKHLGLFKERIDVTSGDERIGSGSDEYHRAVATLAQALRDIVYPADAGEEGPVDAAKPAAVDGPALPGG